MKLIFVDRRLLFLRLCLSFSFIPGKIIISTTTSTLLLPTTWDVGSVFPPEYEKCSIQERHQEGEHINSNVVEEAKGAQERPTELDPSILQRLIEVCKLSSSEGLLSVDTAEVAQRGG